MKKIIILTIIIGLLFMTCKQKEKKETVDIKKTVNNDVIKVNDLRISLHLNSMQKQHQLENMRSHLEALQIIVFLLSNEKYEEASKEAYLKLGSTTEMKLMCASFGDENFEILGLDFHKSADKMSEVFKKKNKKTSLQALSNTMNYCIQCHTTYRQ